MAYITRSYLYYKEVLVKQAAACTLQREPLAADKLPKWWRVENKSCVNPTSHGISK